MLAQVHAAAAVKHRLCGHCEFPLSAGAVAEAETTCVWNILIILMSVLFSVFTLAAPTPSDCAGPVLVFILWPLFAASAVIACSGQQSKIAKHVPLSQIVNELMQASPCLRSDA